MNSLSSLGPFLFVFFHYGQNDDMFCCLKRQYGRPRVWCMPVGVGSSRAVCLVCMHLSERGKVLHLTSNLSGIKLCAPNKSETQLQITTCTGFLSLSFPPFYFSFCLFSSFITNSSSLCAQPLLSTSQRHIIVLETLGSFPQIISLIHTDGNDFASEWKPGV